MVNDEIGVVDNAHRDDRRAATIAAINTGCWKMRAMLGQLVKKGRVPRQKSAIPTCSPRPELNAAARPPDRLDERLVIRISHKPK
jgi:hypothetical protein